MTSLFTQRLKLATIAATALALSLSGLRAQKSYTSVYRIEAGSYAMWHGLNSAGLSQKLSYYVSRGLRVTDVESYRNTSGALRHDIVFDNGSGAQWLYYGMTAAQLVAQDTTRKAQGLFINSLSSWLADGGKRLYTASWRPGPAGPLKLGETQSQFISTWKLQAAAGRRIYDFETYLDANGVRRYDTSYYRSTAGYYLWVNLTEAQLKVKESDMRKLNMGLHSLQSYRDSANVQRFTAVYRPRTTSVRIYFNETEAQMDATWRALSPGIWRMTQLIPAHKGATPQRINYGTGLAGTNGVPSLKMSRPPVIGQNNSFVLGNARGQTTTASFILGIAPTSLALLGGTLLVSPIVVVTTSVGPSGYNLPVTLPASPAMNGRSLYCQQVQLDPGAAQSLSFSRGLRIVLGRHD